MGGTRYSDADYNTKVSYRISTGTPTFDYNHKIKTGAVAAGVHASLNPRGVSIRESRDSGDNIKVPVMVILDTTGSMQAVPRIVQEKLPELFGGFLKDKVSGKKYLGENGYPDILVGAVDDYFAMGPDGALQVGQFESGIEVDDNITNLWLTGQGGGNEGEGYDLALYFAARHTAHDHWDKRKRKGFLFILGDEPVFSKVSRRAVAAVIGDSLPSDIPTSEILKEAQKHYHVIWGYPTGHENTYPGQMDGWRKLFGDERVIQFDPTDVCKFIVGAVAMIEGAISIEELEQDSVAVGNLTTALAPLASAAVAGAAVADLPAVSGAGGMERL